MTDGLSKSVNYCRVKAIVCCWESLRDSSAPAWTLGFSSSHHSYLYPFILICSMVEAIVEKHLKRTHILQVTTAHLCEEQSFQIKKNHTGVYLKQQLLFAW